MPELLRFLAGAAGTAVDPLSALGYVVAGVLSKRAWQAAAGGIGCAIAMDLLVRATSANGYSGQYAAHRIVGGLVVALIVFGIKTLVKRVPRAR